MIREKLEDYVRTIPDFPEPGIMFRDITSVLQDADGLRMRGGVHSKRGGLVRHPGGRRADRNGASSISMAPRWPPRMRPVRICRYYTMKGTRGSTIAE